MAAVEEEITHTAVEVAALENKIRQQIVFLQCS